MGDENTNFKQQIIVLTIDKQGNPQSLVLPEPICVFGNINRAVLIADYQQQVMNEHTVSQPTCEQNNLGSITFDIGVDEVGRGPLYGSVVVTACLLPHLWTGEIDCTNTDHKTASINSQIIDPKNNKRLSQTPLAGLTDSKKISEVKREKLFPLIQQQALAYITAEVPAAVIDHINILQSTLTGMRLVCEQLMVAVVRSIMDSNRLSPVLSHSTTGSITGSITGSNFAARLPTSQQPNIAFNLLIDGNAIPPLDWSYLNDNGLNEHELENSQQKHPSKQSSMTRSGTVAAEAWVKGDGRHTAIAAASVLAKVIRDRQVIEDGLHYPGYGLEKHKGYPTKMHMEAIQQLGVLPQHRRSFRPVKEALESQIDNTLTR